MSESQSIRSALERAVRIVTERPERGQRVYRNVATVRDGLVCHVAEGDWTLTVDAGRALGGQEAGPSPVMILRSALSSCVAMGIKQWAARRDVEIDMVEVVLQTAVDARGQFGVKANIAAGFETIRLEINVTSPAPQETVEEVVSVSLRFSPLMDVFATSHSIETELSVVGIDMEAL